MKKYPETWTATLCSDARSNATMLRESLEELDYTFQRDKEDKHYTRIMVVIPMPQFAYVFKFMISEPADFEVLLYDSKPTHSGTLHHIEIKYISKKNIKAIKKLLKKFTLKLPRKPYKFLLSERLKLGLLAPEYLTSRNKWRMMGIE